MVGVSKGGGEGMGIGGGMGSGILAQDSPQRGGWWVMGRESCALARPVNG